MSPPINAARSRRAYRLVGVYEVNGEGTVPGPEGWFASPRDERYGYSESGHGRLWPEQTEPAE